MQEIWDFDFGSLRWRKINGSAAIFDKYVLVIDFSVLIYHYVEPVGSLVERSDTDLNSDLSVVNFLQFKLRRSCSEMSDTEIRPSYQMATQKD